MNTGLIGCGYVTDHCESTLRLHPELKMVSVAHRDTATAGV